MMDYYTILGLEPGASPNEIRKAFRKSAKLSHPDLHPKDTPDEGRIRKLRFVRLPQAYEVLSNSERRREFDIKRTRSKRKFTTSKNQNRNTSTSSSSHETKTTNENRKQHYENIPEPEEALNALLYEVETLLNQFGLGFRDPLDMLVDWAKRVFQEKFDLWDNGNERSKFSTNIRKNHSGPTCTGNSENWIDELEKELRSIKNTSNNMNFEKVSEQEKNPFLSDDSEIE